MNNKNRSPFIEKIKQLIDVPKSVVISLGLTAVLSALGTASANESDNPPTTNPDIAVSNEVLGKKVVTQGDFGLHDILPGQDSFEMPGVRGDFIVNGSELMQLPPVITPLEVFDTLEITESTKAQLMKWAELFANDPFAKETLDAQLGIELIIDQIKQRLVEGYAIKEVTLQGFASDEDDTAWLNGGDNPGFGVASAKNVELAETRASAVGQRFYDNLLKEGVSIDPSKVVYLPGIEVDDPQLASKIKEVADRLGISTQELVVNYNRGTLNLSANDQEILDGLKDDRYVEIKVILTKPVTGVKYVYEEGGWIEKEVNEDSVSVVLIPILLPWPLIKPKTGTPMPPTEKPITIPIFKGTDITYGPTPRHRRPDVPNIKTNSGYGSIAIAQKQPTTLNTTFGSFGRNKGQPVNRKGRGNPRFNRIK